AMSLAIACFALAARVSPDTAPRFQRFRDFCGDIALPLTWTVAALAMAGSLYFSEVLHLPPCRLCWYQRIAMYPLVVTLGVAAVRRDLSGARRFVIPPALIGAAIAAYHYQLERFPLQPTFSCGAETPCNVTLFLRFGFVSIPF